MSGHTLLDGRERKLATVVFVDLAGSTGLAETLDIEPLEQIMASFRETVMGAIEACGGRAEFVGDAVVGVFGAPIALEDHQGRAVEAADRILIGIDALNGALRSRHGIELGVRVGVNTGEMLVASGDELRLGEVSSDTFNVAARLQQVAGVGEVLVAERTFRALPSRAHDDLGFVRVAGRKRPVHTYRLHRQDPAKARDRTETPSLVGRTDELAVLRRVLGEVVDTGVSRLVTLTGEAGIGKSTLLAAFLADLADDGNVRAAVAGCRHFGKEGPFDPIVRLVSSLSVDLSSTAAIQAFLGPGGERHAGVLAQMLGFEPLDPEVPGPTGQDVNAAWRALVSALSADRPLVWAIEDVHCAEPEVLDLVTAVLTASGRGLLVVATARPEPRPAASGQWPPEGALVIELGPLAEAETAELAWRIEPALRRIPGSGAQIHLETEGNPFFAVELVRSIAEHGAAGIGDLTEVGVPDSVQSVLADRIDRLGAHEKRVLQAAAVVGREFSPSALGPLLKLSTPELQQALSHLMDRSMIQVVEAEESTYRFAHALTRDVAYATIPRRALHGLHESVANWIEAHPAARQSDPAPLIAFHLSQAYRSAASDWTAPPEHTTEVKRRWVAWSVQAACRAAAAGAHGEAKRLAEEALGAAVDEHQLIDALECLGNIHFFNYEGDAAWRRLTEAADRATAVGSRSAAEIAGMNIRALQAALRWTGGMSQLVNPAELGHRIELVEKLLAPDDSVDRVRLLTCIGFWPYATVGLVGADFVDIPKARDAAESAASMAKRLNRPDLHSAALDALASSFIFRGEYAGADAITKRRLALYDQLDDPWEQGDLCAMGGWIGFQRGRYREAVEWTSRGVVEFAEYPSIGLHCRTWRGLARLRKGDWNGLLEDCEVVEKALVTGPPAPYMTAIVAAAALVRHLRGDEAESDRMTGLLEAFEAVDPPGPDEVPMARWAEYLAPITARRGRPQTALDMIDAGSRRRRSRLGQLLAARCVVVVDGSCWEEAQETLVACRRQAVEGGTPVAGAAAHWLEGSKLAAAGEWDAAAGAFERAVATTGEPQDLWLTGRSHLGLAESQLQLAESVLARQSAERAASILGALGSVEEQSRALTVLARACEP